jgi:hypothetical protein
MRKEFLTDEEAPEGYTPKPTPKSRVLPPRPEDIAKMKEPRAEVKIYKHRSEVPEHLRPKLEPEPIKMSKVSPNEMAEVVAKRMAARKEKDRQKAIDELANPYKSRLMAQLKELHDKRHGKVPAQPEVESEPEEDKPARPKKQGSAKRVRVDNEGATAAEK